MGRLIDSPMGNQRRVSSQDNLIDGRELETDYRTLSNDALKTSLIIIWIPPIKQSEVKHLLKKWDQAQKTVDGLQF